MTALLDDTSRCPLASQCAACGGGRDLAVATAETPVGVYCLTLCGDCADKGRTSRPSGWGAAVELVISHCEHLGIDADQMAALMEGGET